MVQSMCSVLKKYFDKQVKFRGLMGKLYSVRKLQIPSRHDSKHTDGNST